MPKDNDEIKKLGEKLREMANQERKGLKPTKKAPTLAEMIAEGGRLLDEEQKKTTPKKVSTPSPIETSSNPYVKARNKILQGYNEWRRREIAEMEKTGNVNNRFYNDFVHEVAVLGDSLS